MTPKPKKLDIGKLIRALALIAVIFIIAFVIIFAVVQNFKLLFDIIDIVEVLLIINCFLYMVYKLLFSGRWIRAIVLGFSSLLFIILSLSFASANITAYISNSTNVPALVGTNIFTSLIGLAVGGILYYITFNGYPLHWIEELKEKVEETEHRKKWLAKIIRRLKGAK